MHRFRQSKKIRLVCGSTLATFG
ncbi:putative cross-wall-targeting lipoprotein signal domain-containing proteiin [Floridanema aerugineum]|uniref:Cross-wall-targeting lipoprotein signal domain-containing protein n=1 Tax=Floridaenema aerugineum BLCC-F46 TaxID=3153654 RepID=A0ABV4WZG2_9CYAN